MSKFKILLSSLAIGFLVLFTASCSNISSNSNISQIVVTNTPAVVYITSTAIRNAPPDADSDEDEKDAKSEHHFLGTGFIISSDGLIATNNHMVRGAFEVNVELQDGRKFPAKIIGTDERTDLAVLKIEADTPLTVIKWGDSSKATVGEHVVAIGNPLGLTFTVTTGIISAKNRDLEAGPLDQFIQTDASINPGNSGGPLFNMAGEVIGINSMIYSPTKSSIGLGFAIPSNEARKVIDVLIKNGAVEYARLGVSYQPINALMQKALGLDHAGYAFITSVNKDGPAGGILQEGDVIVKINNIQLTPKISLIRAILLQQPGDKIILEVIRDNQLITVQIIMGRSKDEVVEVKPPSTSYTENRETLGLTLKELTPELRKILHAPDSLHGVLVNSTAPGEGLKANLIMGVVIISIDGKEMNTIDDVKAAIKNGHTRGAILVKAIRRGEVRFIPVEVP
jgi:serine protease Do